MSKTAENEQKKLRATFYNNLAVGAALTGFFAPYFGFMKGFVEQGGALSVWGTAAFVSTGFGGLLIAFVFRTIATNSIQDLQD